MKNPVLLPVVLRMLACASAAMLAACARAPTLKVSDGAPPIDIFDVESTTILTAEQIANIEIPCCDAPTVLDSTSQRGNRDWRYLRSELAKSEKRMDLPVLAQQCRRGSPDTYAFVHARGLAWTSDEDAIVLREATPMSPATLQRIERRWDGKAPGAVNLRREAMLDAADWPPIAARLEQLKVRLFPAEIDGVGWIHSPDWYFESCLDGEFRMTVLSGGHMGMDASRMRHKSEFFLAAALLIDAAEQHGLRAQPEAE
ncbi:hypothetical protein [Arenimonas sp.]|uniref:hypothetical protein n=1 Tax=Arenimonas sp. TaxID=1872635 RepID=UPI0039E21439